MVNGLNNKNKRKEKYKKVLNKVNYIEILYKNKLQSVKKQKCTLRLMNEKTKSNQTYVLTINKEGKKLNLSNIFFHVNFYALACQSESFL